MLFLPTCPRPRVRCKLSGDCTPRVLPRASRSGRHVGLRPPRNDKETWWVCKPIVGEGQCPSRRFCVQNRIAAGNLEIPLVCGRGTAPPLQKIANLDVIPRAGRPVGIRSLAPRVYEGGGPKGRGEKNSILPNSPSHGFRRASRLRAARSAALTAHRAVIHFRRLRFAYPLKSGGRGCGGDIRGLPRRASPSSQ